MCTIKAHNVIYLFQDGFNHITDTKQSQNDHGNLVPYFNESSLIRSKEHGCQ